MDLRIDEKGKYFTPRIAKDSLLAILRTDQQLIVGLLYVRPDKRLKDELNDPAQEFIALTDVRVFDPGGTAMLYSASFMLVSRKHIVTVTPLDAISGPLTAPWYPQVDVPEDAE